MYIAAAAVLLLVLWIAGHAHARTLERRVAEGYPRGASGVMSGAEEIRRGGSNGCAVLLIHGCGDTPQTLWHVADELNRRGYAVDAPLLPGHGRSLADFYGQSADEWFAEVAAKYFALRGSHDWVGVMGLSMGGALSAQLAAEHPDLPALVLVSPYLAMPRVNDILTMVSWVWGPFVPVVNTATDASLFDPAARAGSLAYGAMTVSALRALRATAHRGRRALAGVRAPTLIIQSRRDNRVSAQDTQRAYERLGASEKTIEWIDGAGHVITVDFGWQRVAGLIADWMDAHRPAD
jgi:carboxylesterase